MSCASTVRISTIRRNRAIGSITRAALPFAAVSIVRVPFVREPIAGAGRSRAVGPALPPPAAPAADRARPARPAPFPGARAVKPSSPCASSACATACPAASTARGVPSRKSPLTQRAPWKARRLSISMTLIARRRQFDRQKVHPADLRDQRLARGGRRADVGRDMAERRADEHRRARPECAQIIGPAREGGLRRGSLGRACPPAERSSRYRVRYRARSRAGRLRPALRAGRPAAVRSGRWRWRRLRAAPGGSVRRLWRWRPVRRVAAANRRSGAAGTLIAAMAPSSCRP